MTFQRTGRFTVETVSDDEQVLRLTVVTVPDCPNAPLMEVRLAEALADLGAERRVSIARQVINDAEQAVRWQMRGSPTLLIDGVDPFADPATPAGLACRMYRDEQGHIDGAPTGAALRDVLCRALDPLGRAGAGRVAPVQGGLRAVQQRVLRSFAEHGRAPKVEDERALVKLHADDFLRLDASGQISAAYPFSAVPTPHRVRIDGGAEVFAMCAIDALGMAAMLGRTVHITSQDPHGGEPIAVTVTAAGQASWAPGTAVVFAGQQADGAAAEVCCGHVNFFASAEAAEAWAAAHPQVTGRVLDQDRALELGAAIFGPLLAGHARKVT